MLPTNNESPILCSRIGFGHINSAILVIRQGDYVAHYKWVTNIRH